MFNRVARFFGFNRHSSSSLVTTPAPLVQNTVHQATFNTNVSLSRDYAPHPPFSVLYCPTSETAREIFGTIAGDDFWKKTEASREKSSYVYIGDRSIVINCDYFNQAKLSFYDENEDERYLKNILLIFEPPSPYSRPLADEKTVWNIAHADNVYEQVNVGREDNQTSSQKPSSSHHATNIASAGTVFRGSVPLNQTDIDIEENSGISSAKKKPRRPSSKQASPRNSGTLASITAPLVQNSSSSVVFNTTTTACFSPQHYAPPLPNCSVIYVPRDQLSFHNFFGKMGDSLLDNIPPTMWQINTQELFVSVTVDDENNKSIEITKKYRFSYGVVLFFKNAPEDYFYSSAHVFNIGHVDNYVGELNA